nr:transposase [Microcystis aeruginosa K13-06]
MIVLEMKAVVKPSQCSILSINIVQFAAIQFKFVDTLNSTARQASAERAWSAIARFYDNCKKKIKGKKGYPKFQKNNRSVEYKNCGWKLSEDRKKITFTDKKNIGTVKLKGTRDLNFYPIDQIKRVRIV